MNWPLAPEPKDTLSARGVQENPGRQGQDMA